MKKANSERDADIYPNLSESCYWEFKPNTSREYGYYYYLQVAEKDYHITGEGVSVTYEDGSSIHTNIFPKNRFKFDVNALSEESLLHIISLPVEGRRYSKEEMDEYYKYWKGMS